MKKLGVLIGIMFISGCFLEEPKTAVDAKKQEPCHIVWFQVPEQPQVCAVRCSWNEEERGYSDTTPVPCSWFGKPMTTFPVGVGVK